MAMGERKSGGYFGRFGFGGGGGMGAGSWWGRGGGGDSFSLGLGVGGGDGLSGIVRLLWLASGHHLFACTKAIHAQVDFLLTLQEQRIICLKLHRV